MQSICEFNVEHCARSTFTTFDLLWYSWLLMGPSMVLLGMAWIDVHCAANISHLTLRIAINCLLSKEPGQSVSYFFLSMLALETSESNIQVCSHVCLSEQVLQFGAVGLI